MTTLVTGGAGYVGSHAVAHLHAGGRDVVVLDNFSNARRETMEALTSLTSSPLVVVEGDASDSALVERLFDEHGVSEIVHFAAHKSVPESVAHPLRYFRNNVVSTLALAEAGVARNVQRFVFSSSAVVYGISSELPVTEESALAPVSPYGVTKQMCERILAEAAAVSEMRVVALRYFNPVGAHPSGYLGEAPVGEATNVVPMVMRTATGDLAKLPVFGGDYPTRDGTTIRDYVHVMDLAEGHLAALEADLGDHASRVFNLGTGAGTTVLELIAAAREVTGRAIPYEIVARRPGDLAASWANCDRAARELGWRAHRDITQALADHWNYLSPDADDHA